KDSVGLRKRNKALKGLTEGFKDILPLQLINLGLHLFRCVLLRSSESEFSSRAEASQKISHHLQAVISGKLT
ncbi:uncharacterized, partial [Tachysurus ichikawai]